tara:strand:+ start:1784 stop:2263 length:480 start_codon:yes stop_codon:yes gene_type:complete
VTTTDTNHAERNAIGHAQTIEALYELHCWDADTATPLTDEAKDILADLAWSNDGSTADAFQDAVTDYAREMPLTVMVRSDWQPVGGSFSFQAQEFKILLSTGGPACRIIGELDSGSVAWQSGCRPVMQHQDWFKPWTEISYDIDTNALLWFCEQFYFGE